MSPIYRDTMILWIVNGKCHQYEMFYGYWSQTKNNKFSEEELFEVWTAVRGSMLHFPTGWYEDWNDCPLCNADPHDCECDAEKVKTLRERCTAIRQMLRRMDDIHRERWRGNGCPEFTPSPLLYRMAVRFHTLLKEFVKL